MPRLDEGFCSEGYYAAHLTLHVFYVIVTYKWDQLRKRGFADEKKPLCVCAV